MLALTFRVLDWLASRSSIGAIGCGLGMMLCSTTHHLNVRIGRQLPPRSHYARQLQGWAVFLSWTGQRYNGGRLTFSPTCEGARPTRSVNASQPLSSMAYLIMPFITPGAVGTVTLTWVDGPRGNGSMLSPTCTLQQLYGDLVMSAATVDLRRCIGLPRSIAQKADCILERF